MNSKEIPPPQGYVSRLCACLNEVLVPADHAGAVECEVCQRDGGVAARQQQAAAAATEVSARRAELRQVEERTNAELMRRWLSGEARPRSGRRPSSPPARRGVLPPAPDEIADRRDG